jgi:hypothetical protein
VRIKSEAACLLAGAVATRQPQRIKKPNECGLHSRALDEVHAPVLPVFRAWPHRLFRPHWALTDEIKRNCCSRAADVNFTLPVLDEAISFLEIHKKQKEIVDYVFFLSLSFIVYVVFYLFFRMKYVLGSNFLFTIKMRCLILIKRLYRKWDLDGGTLNLEVSVSCLCDTCYIRV